MTLEEAKKQLARFMESGGTKEQLEKFIERVWGKPEMMAAIMDLLIPDSQRRKAAD